VAALGFVGWWRLDVGVIVLGACVVIPDDMWTLPLITITAYLVVIHAAGDDRTVTFN
jgi:hypothetical protein